MYNVYYALRYSIPHVRRLTNFDFIFTLYSILISIPEWALNGEECACISCVCKRIVYSLFIAGNCNSVFDNSHYLHLLLDL